MLINEQVNASTGQVDYPEKGDLLLHQLLFNGLDLLKLDVTRSPANTCEPQYTVLLSPAFP